MIAKRVALTLVAADPSETPCVLVTAFNKLMIDRLVGWVVESLEAEPTVRGVNAVCEQRGWHTIKAQSGGRVATVVAINRDKLPSRILGGKGKWVPSFRAAVEKRLREHSSPSAPLSDHLEPGFLEDEFEQVIYAEPCLDRTQYLEIRRKGRQKGLLRDARKEVWRVLQEPPLDSLIQRRMDAYRSHSGRIREEEQLDLDRPWTHVFVDECQDFTRADIQLLARIPPDPTRLVMAGDETQSLHLGSTYRRPSIDRRGWTTHRLGGSYRLPRRVAQAIRPLAEHLEHTHQIGRDDQLDLVLLESRRSASPGHRPMVVAGTESIGEDLRQIVRDHRDLLSFHGNGMGILVPEGDHGLVESIEAAGGGKVTRGSMNKLKGLEAPGVVFSDRVSIDAGESLGEWVYTALTRATNLLVLVLWPDASPDIKEVLGRLDRMHLNFRDEEATARFEECEKLAESA